MNTSMYLSLKFFNSVGAGVSDLSVSLPLILYGAKVKNVWNYTWTPP